MTELLDQMATARSAWASNPLRRWYAVDQLHAQVREALSQEASWVGDAEFGRGFRNALGRPDVPDPLAWANHLVDLPDEGWALAHLRFRYGDPARAFVDVVATTAPPTPDGLARVAAAALPAYAPFAPLCLRVEVPDAPGLLTDLAGDDRFGPCAVAHHVLAGPVADLRRHSRAAAHPSVRLRPTAPEQAAERAAGIYAQLARVEPPISAWARPQDAASLAEPAEAGLLFEVLVDGQPAGVVAAGRDDDHAMTGFTVVELCLDSDHRGRRLAPALLQRLVDELPARAGDVLWGTVHPDNTPSLRNALSTGRTITSSVLWITPASYPGMTDATASRPHSMTHGRHDPRGLDPRPSLQTIAGGQSRQS